jgi:hypothetical protein
MISVLLVGLRPAMVENFRWELDRQDVELLAGTDLDGLRAALADKKVDHVILGGGLDIPERADAIREVVRLSDQATVHVKDQLSGSEGFIPFARALLRGLADYRPEQSDDGAARAQLRD